MKMTQMHSVTAVNTTTKETATVYLRARNYNPSTGRFTQRDSYAGRRTDPLSLNLYTYCANNPVYFF